MHGIDAIPEKWIAPIGRKIKTAFLNLGELGFFGAQLPQDVDDLTDRTERIARQVLLRWRLPVELAEGKPTDLSDLKRETLSAPDSGASLYRNLGGPVFRFPMFNVAVDYCDGPLIVNGAAKSVKLTDINTYKIQAQRPGPVASPGGMAGASPRRSARHTWVRASSGTGSTMEFQLLTDKVTSNVTRLAAELVVDSRPTTMLVPVVLVNGTVPSDRPH